MIKLVVSMTCHNRREKTLACLRALFAADLPGKIRLEVILVDDGSTDETGVASAALDPRVSVIYGDGRLFWNGGMRMAIAEAMKRQPNFFLWLNDDTTLEEFGLNHLLDTFESLRHAHGDRLVIVGATCDPESKQFTYGGYRRCGGFFRPLALEMVGPGGVPVQCDTMNGHCVLLPAIVPALIGNLDPGFIHTMGDVDYGLRARKNGCSIWVAPRFIGTCARNSSVGQFNDVDLPMRQRMRNVISTKSLPPKPWAVYTRRHAGFFWPVYWAWPYVKTAISSLRNFGR